MKDEAFQIEPFMTVLHKSALFADVDLSALHAELNESRELCIEAGQVLLDPSQVNTDIFVVISGELLVCLEPRIHKPLVRLGVGECVGELSIIDTAPPSAFVVAAVETRLLAIPKPVLWRMLEMQKSMALNLLHVLSRRIRENNVVLLGSLVLQREYRNKAETDALTGLHNRAWFEEIFPKQLELCERTGQHASLLMLDIDHFKRVNDEFGHQSGDLALRHLGLILQKNLRSTDLCARYGGEEMIVLMPGTEMAQAKLTADRLRENVADSPVVLPNGDQLKLQVSGGLSQWQPGISLEELVRTADLALYRAKEGGRNRIISSLHPMNLRG